MKKNKNIRKFKGGGMDARHPFSSGYKGAKKTSSIIHGGNDPKKVTSSNVKTGVTGSNNQKSRIIMGPGAAVFKGLLLDPFLKKSRMRKMRGESFFRKKPIGLPSTKDYYRAFGEPFDPMSKKGVDYMKEAGLITNTPPGGTPDNDPKRLCPDGFSFPPCPPMATGPAQPVKAKKGKMAKKSKMSCPHRPDGIRGMGAAIRGHKFTGVK